MQSGRVMSFQMESNRLRATVAVKAEANWREEDGSEEDGSEEDGGEEDGSGTRSCGSFHMRRGNVDVNCAKASGSGERSKPVACSKIAS